jgi:UDP-glucose 4-epimerase
MQKAEDMGEFYRIPADNRDLNYSRYFSEGETDISKIEDYHSHNTTQLTNDELKQTLLNLDYIKENL